MSIEPTKHGTWRVRWRDAQRADRARAFPTREEAESFQASMRAEKIAAGVGGARRGQLFAGAEVVAVLNPHAFHVYVLWGWDDKQPLYVGSSIQVLSRVAWHLQRREKRESVRRVTVLRCDTSDAMRDLERRLIAEHQPPLNVMGVTRGRWAS